MSLSFQKYHLDIEEEISYDMLYAVTNEWIVEFTDEFELWWLELSELVQEKCAVVFDLLTRDGPNLQFPYSSSIRGSVHALLASSANAKKWRS